VLAYVSCRGYVGTLLSVRLIAVKQGGTADYNNSSLIELIYSVRDFLLQAFIQQSDKIEGVAARGF
jgi:hypothetical protein